MSKRCCLLLLLVICFITVIPFTVMAATEGDYEYTVFNNQVTITSFCNKQLQGELIIPNEIAGYPVTAIGSQAFFCCYYLTKITIPAGVTTIEKYAFLECSSLVEIVIPDGVTTIEDGAFYGCISLTGIELPDSLKTIGEAAFSQCYQLKYIVIPEGVSVINKETFFDAASLERIWLPSTLTKIDSLAFQYTDLMWLYYSGTQEEWNQIEIDLSSNKVMKGIEVAYNYSSNAINTAKVIQNGQEKIQVSTNGIPSNKQLIFACYQNERLVYVMPMNTRYQNIYYFSPDAAYDTAKVMIFQSFSDCVPMNEAKPLECD